MKNIMEMVNAQAKLIANLNQRLNLLSSRSQPTEIKPEKGLKFFINNGVGSFYAVLNGLEQKTEGVEIELLIASNNTVILSQVGLALTWGAARPADVKMMEAWRKTLKHSRLYFERPFIPGQWVRMKFAMPETTLPALAFISFELDFTRMEFAIPDFDAADKNVSAGEPEAVPAPAKAPARTRAVRKTKKATTE